MKRKKFLWLLPLLAVFIVLSLLLIPRTKEEQDVFIHKADLLKEEIVTDDVARMLEDMPTDPFGYAIFFSVCDGTSRTKVYKGTGKSLYDAWENAVKNTSKALKEDPIELIWLRADVVNRAWPISLETLSHEIDNASKGFDFNGISFDEELETALLEGELNGRGIYNYKANTIDMDQLNAWMKENGKESIQTLSEPITVFKCNGWFCDENDDVYTLISDGADTGRRVVSKIDADYAKNIIDTSSSFLMDQIKEDGTFVYGIKPQFDEELDTYNILRHSGAIWSLICRYRMFPDGELKEKIESTINYLISQIRYDDTGAAYLHEAKDYEFKLGGNGLAIVTLTEYMDVFQNEKYREVSEALGKGILKQQNPENGSYWHVLNNDFSRGEDFRTVYYDGECTFALARLYSLTGEQKWLDAACKAIDRFIAEDYTQYRDHWVAYSLNEVTKYVDKKEYYDFALENAANNYERIMGRIRTYPTNLELLISSFETWQRMVDKGIDTGDFDVKELLYVIDARANRQLSGYFYPELAMYMQNPRHILGSFMMRNDKFRVRIDDVQHNIGGFYLYWKNYDAMVAAGLDKARDSKQNGD